MPSVDVAMARSLRGGVWGSIAQGLHSSLAPRDVGGLQDKATDAATAFSSWDNCMDVNYCKWPVIAVIIVGGLIILSIVWCIIRCACCGLSCCCSCFQCLKCCGNCCGCCDPPKSSRHKYLDNETIPPNYGYRPEPPMKAPDFAHSRPMPTRAHEPPQYAEFETSRKGGDDSLPSMPTWEQANSRKVEMEVEAVEMNQLNKPQDSGQSVASASAAAAASAAAVAAAAGNHGPQRQGSRDPYRQPSPMDGMGYAAQDPYAGSHHGYEDYGNGSYGPATSHFGAGQYGAAAAGMPTSPRRASPPRQDYGYRGYDTGPPARTYARSPQPADPYARSSPAADPYARSSPAAELYAQMPQSPNRYAQTPQPMDGYTQMPEMPDRYAQTPQPAGPYGQMPQSTDPYGADLRGPSPSAVGYAVGRTGNSPAPPADFRMDRMGSNASPAPMAGYRTERMGNNASPAPMAGYRTERMGSNASPAPMAGYRTERMGSNASPAPQADYGHGNQQYASTAGHGQHQADPQSPLQNSAGFDFNSGYSRSPVEDQFGGGQASPTAQQAPKNGGFTAYTPHSQ